MSCATNGGEVYTSLDAGETWTPQPPPPGGTQVYALGARLKVASHAATYKTHPLFPKKVGKIDARRAYRNDLTAG